MYIMNICAKFTVDGSGFMSMLMYMRTYLHSYTPYLYAYRNLYMT